MSKSTISTFELFAMFPDQETARTYLEGRLWPEGPKCPVCGKPASIEWSTSNEYRWGCEKCDIRYDDEGNIPPK